MLRAAQVCCPFFIVRATKSLFASYTDRGYSMPIMGLLDTDTKTFSDEEILARSVRNPSIFAALVDRYEAAFLRKARHIIGNREEVIDIVQDTFTKIYLNANKFKVQEGASFK